MTNTSALTTEQSDMLESLATHRSFLRFTARGLTDEQLRERATVSELCIGGLLKHVAAVEQGWAGFIVDGPIPARGRSRPAWRHTAKASGYVTTTRRSRFLRCITSSPRQPTGLSPACPAGHGPSICPRHHGSSLGNEVRVWSARRVVLHIIAETAQHAGHADIIREALDGAKTMG